jgi:16S rRNA (guanine966-N2)-methyltransferase
VPGRPKQAAHPLGGSRDVPVGRGAHAHEVRLIGGQWKRTKLPVADRPGLRPTPDRVRETLFNWLGQDLAGWRVLDAFAGSGALGFEAASRGAGEVVLLERDAILARSLAASKDRLHADALQVHATDALAWMMGAAHGRFDLVLLDPPFDAGLHGPATDAASKLLKPGGWLYVESDKQLEPSPGFESHRHLKAGAVHAHLWRRADNPKP